MKTISLGDHVTWQGPGEWHSYANAVQSPVAGLRGRLQQPDGGFTHDPRTGRDVTRGFVVAAFPERSRDLPLDQVTASDIESYMFDNADLLQRDGYVLGGWHDPDTGRVWLDVSVVTQSRQKAIELAQQNNQIAVFDLAKFESIPTGGTGQA